MKTSIIKELVEKNIPRDKLLELIKILNALPEAEAYQLLQTLRRCSPI